MLYRCLPKANIELSVLGLGGVPMNGMEPGSITNLVEYASSVGINLLDIYMAEAWIRDAIGAAVKGKRRDFYIQGHIGTRSENGKTVRTRDLKETMASFDDLRRRLGTDYIDFGMLYFVDSDKDYDDVFNSDIIDYAIKLKEEGSIRLIGMGSHNPHTALRAVNTGLVDMLMFSINPAYDLARSDVDIFTLKEHQGFHGEGLKVDGARQQLYATCQQQGTAITVMKSLGAGTLLTAEHSPFGKAMTVPQCIEYALERPAVVSAILGCKNRSELDTALRYFDADTPEREYSHIFS
ncbi:MAG: aldo/keto reductase, partial [Bacillota bacterium]|nr:aldo/keto reductase [Bacillota bacterium]